MVNSRFHMKKLLILICVVVILGLLISLKHSRSTPSTPSAITPSPTGNSTTNSPSLSFTFDEMSLEVFFFQVKKEETIQLIPNYAERKLTRDIIQEHSCIKGINGGFYDTNNAPLGLVQSGSSRIGAPLSSNLFNGYLAIRGSITQIGRSVPQENWDIILQSGPILIENGSALNLKLTADEHARRSVALVSEDTVYFLSIFEKESLYSGPLLTTLPEVIKTFASLKNIPITSAINLDGGGASAFYFPPATLSELMTVGSFFCISEV